MEVNEVQRQQSISINLLVSVVGGLLLALTILGKIYALAPSLHTSDTFRGPITTTVPYPVVINEIQYHPASGNHGEEYIELYNTGLMTVDLSGWRFSDGIVYTFPLSITIPPGRFLVVGHDPPTVEALYGITGVVGPFEGGRLANEGERIALEDDSGFLVDALTYDDHFPWPEAPDGEGPSLELLNPLFENDSPCSWQASTGLGTPGLQNSVYISGNIPPCIYNVGAAPLFPAPGQPVTVTVVVADSSALVTVTLHYRPQGTLDYLPITMTTGDSHTYTATIPEAAQVDGRYVEFYVAAVDNAGMERVVPPGAPGTISSETGLPLTISYLYLTEASPPTSSLPIYRLIMTEENQAELEARDLFSNELLDATFVYSHEVFYNVGVRYRGEHSRSFWPRPYRIKFQDAHEFQERERINLVNDEVGREAMAHDLFRRAGLPASDTRFVTFYINDRRVGDYLDVEQVDNEFLRAHFPGQSGGNLYRGFDGADLSYRGPDPDSYRPYYLKKNNEEADDYSDVIALTDALTNSSDETFPTRADEVADMRQWLRWFAVQAVLDNHEGALWMGVGDDYFLYHRPSDDRFVLISWDHDATFMYPDHTVWEPDWYACPIVKRILHAPLFTRWYYQEIYALTQGAFSEAEMIPRIDALPAVVDDGDRNYLKWYVPQRIDYLLHNEIPHTELGVSTNGGQDWSTSQTEITLEGVCSVLRDVSVTQNGQPLDVTYPTETTWQVGTTLTMRDNVFVISDGRDTRTVRVFWDFFRGGVLTDDLTLPGSQLPYEINDTIVVPAGVTFTIEPGATLQFHAGRYLRVEPGGRLWIEGTREQPVVLTHYGDGYWGGILLDRTQADNRIVHALIEYTEVEVENPRTHTISAYGARITVADSIIRHTRENVAIHTYPWGDIEPTAYILRNEIYDIESDAIHVTSGYAWIQGNHIYDVFHGTYPLEGIEVSHMITPAVLLDNHVHDVSDDCFDLNHSSAFIARNELHHCGDKGISIGHPSSSTLINNLVYACIGKDGDQYSGSGVAIKDGAVARIVNNTVADSRHGLYLYEGHEGEGGGTATVVNTILWGNGVDLELDALSTVTVTYSDIGIGIGTALPSNGVWPGEGNICADPLYRNPSQENYRLAETSPCVDTGTADGAPTEDIHAIYRPHGAGYDRGAYEFFEFYQSYLPAITAQAVSRSLSEELLP